jgi:group I intron endonuclease
MDGIIYKVANLINGKVYIGQTVNTLRKRKTQHKTASKRKKYEDMLLYKAFKKYGFENFEWKIIDNASNENDLNEKEVYWIKYYNSYIGFKNCNGYNMTLGGHGKRGAIHSEETRKKLSKFRTGKWIGSDSPTAKKVVCLNLNGTFVKSYGCLDDASKDVGCSLSLISSNCTGNRSSAYGFIFIFEDDYNEETVKRRVEQYLDSSDFCRILRTGLDGKYIKTYNSTKEAGEDVNGFGTAILRCCKNEMVSAYDSLWFFEDDYNEKELRSKLDKLNTRHQPKKVVQLTVNDEFIAVFPTITEGANRINGDASSITKCCKGKQKTAYGFKWMYEDDYNERPKGD